MTDKQADLIHITQEPPHADRCENNRANLNRIRRIKGQLNALERMIEADEGTCAERVVRARTIEKGMTSLINHLVECYVENTVSLTMQDDPEAATADIMEIVRLLNR